MVSPHYPKKPKGVSEYHAMVCSRYSMGENPHLEGNINLEMRKGVLTCSGVLQLSRVLDGF